MENCLLCSGDIGGHPGLYIHVDGMSWPCAACKGTGKVKPEVNWGKPVPAFKVDFSPKMFDFDTAFAILAISTVVGSLVLISVGILKGI